MKVFCRTLTVLFIVSIIISAGKAHASSWSLNRSQSIASGINTSFDVNADFNGDGIMDIATCSRVAPGKISIFIGKGDGKFFKKITFNTGKKPVSMAAGDLNGDGILDIAVANWGDNAIGTTPPVDPGGVTVHIGKGDGTFKTNIEDPNSGISYPVGANPVYIVCADINGDGNPDLAVANWWSDSVSVLPGNGDGTFQAKIDTAAGNRPRSIAVSDIDKDGKLDIAVSNWSNDTVSILHGDGSGNFPGKTDFNVGKNPVSVAASDINGDGWLDIVTANFDSDNISVVLADGAGGFKPAGFLATPAGPSFVLVKDFDGDGRQDIVTCNGSASNLSMFFGLGDGTFQTRREFTAGTYPAAALFSDFNSDGGWDLAVANYTSGNLMLFNAKNKLTGDWKFITGPIVSTPLSPTSVFATDLNRDEYTDVAATDGGNVSILLNDGNGALGAPANYTAGTAPVDVTAADFTGDGIKDIAVANSGSNDVTILKGAVNGTYSAIGPFAAGSAPVSVVNGDFNKDGKMDLAVCNSGGAPGSVSVLIGNGDGTFPVTNTYSVGNSPRKVVAADFNGDGTLDLAVANNIDNTVSVLIGVGDGTFQAAVQYPAGNAPASIAAADFFVDKKTDLAVLNSTGNVSILLNNGNGTFKAPTSFATGTNPQSIAAADLNLDGRPDLAVTSGDTVYTYFGKGSAVFDLVTSPTITINGAVAAVISEFNKDGKADIAVASSTDSGIYVVNGVDQFNITTSVSGSGSVSPASGDYEAGKYVILNATPDPGFYFKNWSGGTSSTENPHLLLLASNTKNKTFTANFFSGPYIAGLSASQGVLKDSITITGSNFGTSKGTVNIGATTAPVTSWADTSITFTVPTNILCNKYKLFVIAGGKSSNRADFYIPKAFITGADAPSVIVPLDFTVTGTGFGPDKVTVSLLALDKLSGTNCTVKSFSNTSVTFTVPKLAAGKYIIKMKNAHGYSNGWPLTIN